MWWRGGGSAKRCRIPPALGILLWLAAAPSLAAPLAEPTLSRTTVPARGRQEAILAVPAFGRFALKRSSSTGSIGRSQSKAHAGDGHHGNGEELPHSS